MALYDFSGCALGYFHRCCLWVLWRDMLEVLGIFHSVMLGDIMCVMREHLDGLVCSLIAADMTPLYLIVSCAVSAWGRSSSDQGVLWSIVVLSALPCCSSFVGLHDVGGGLYSLLCHLLRIVVAKLSFDLGAHPPGSEENCHALVNVVEYTTVLPYYWWGIFPIL